MKAYSTLTMLSLVGALILFVGCGTGNDVYGDGISNYETTDIKDILTKPQDYEGKTVTIKGTIVRECPSGCWLDVGSGNAALHVDINPAGFAIPQEVGSQVVVEGEIQYLDNQVSMAGQGVEIQ